jgi:hypothetical protein
LPSPDSGLSPGPAVCPITSAYSLKSLPADAVNPTPPTRISARAKLRVRCYRHLERADPQLVTALGCLLILMALEAWNRPYFFGDDNMQFTFVHMSEIARNFVHGENVFRHHFIFGGGFDMRDDPTFLSLWHPLSLLCSLLTLTRWKYMAVDVFVAVCLVGAGVVMARLLVLLRQQKHLRLSNTLVVFLSAGYACSGYSIVIGASWGNFTANIAALPMLLIGVLHSRLGRGVFWVTFAGLLGLFAGHVDPLCYSYAFLSLLAALISWQHRSIRPLLILALGILATALVSSPILWHSWCGFATSSRAAGSSPAEASSYSIPLLQLLTGYFGGSLAGLAVNPVRIFDLHSDGCFVLTTSFSSLLVWVALVRCRRGRFLSLAFLLFVLLAILLVNRPPFLAQLMLHLPVFKSFKWPFRQIMLLQFFVTLWIALNVGRLSMRHAWKFMAAGPLIYGLSLWHLGRPAFSDHGDRQLVLSGAAEQFWTKVKRDMPANAVFVAPDASGCMSLRKYPFCMSGAVNFPALYLVTMAGGYSFTKPCNSPKTKVACHPFLGSFHKEEMPELLRIYKELYIMEVLPPSSLRVGVFDLDYENYVKNARVVRDVESWMNLPTDAVKELPAAISSGNDRAQRARAPLPSKVPSADLNIAR